LLGRNGDILFVSLRVRNGHELLYLMRADGTHQRPITRAPGNVAAPTWSPAGKSIAYRTAETLKRPCTKIYVMRADGTRARRLTHDGGCYNNPAWSPEGRRLAFEREGASGSSVWTMNINGVGLRRLTHGGLDSDPAWSPDGKTIAFARYTGSGAIWLIDADGSNERQLTTPRGEGDIQPDWSPNGGWIAFSRSDDPTEGRGGTRYRHDIWLVRPDGTGLRKLTRHAGGNYSPVWSPDGKRIVFGSDRKHSDLMDIYVMNADGKRQTRLTKGTIDNSSPDWRARP
jgi:TolB protein